MSSTTAEPTRAWYVDALLRQMQDLARGLGIITRHPGWVAALTTRQYALAAPKLAILRAMERRAGGYYVDSSVLNATVRFVPRDTCVNCGSQKEEHLESGQCLFIPGGTFEETKP